MNTTQKINTLHREAIKEAMEIIMMMDITMMNMMINTITKETSPIMGVMVVMAVNLEAMGEEVDGIKVVPIEGGIEVEVVIKEITLVPVTIQKHLRL